MPERNLDFKQRALLVTSSAAWRWNKMLLAELKGEMNSTSRKFGKEMAKCGADDGIV